ncbi:MAG: hypothetical protein IJ217_03170 [Clostridia bacterium]|nr:hypothetical protein [Clostridia bacterium]
MREVIDFFYEVYPYPVHDSVKETLNELLLAKKGTKSVIGMINVIDNLVGWKDWRQKAYVRFHISL